MARGKRGRPRHNKAPAASPRSPSPAPTSPSASDNRATAETILEASNSSPTMAIHQAQPLEKSVAIQSTPAQQPSASANLGASIVKSSYASLVDPNEGTALRYYEPSIINGVKCAKITAEDVAPEIQFWQSAILCSVLGANPSLDDMEGYLRRIWNPSDIDRISLVEPNAHRIEEHRRKYDRLHKEREERSQRERQRQQDETQVAYEKAKKEGQSSYGGGSPGCMPGRFPGGFPGAMPGGFPGGMPANFDFRKILNDPELMAAFNDPEIMAALQDMMKNPANLAKHQANPRVAPVLAKIMTVFAGAM